MSGRRLLGAGGAAVFALLLAATPAPAAEPTVEWTRPTIEDPVIRAPGLITGKVTTEEGDNQAVKRIAFELVQPVDAPENPCFAELDAGRKVQEFTDKPASVSFELPIHFPCNGAYDLEADVTYEDRVLGEVSLGERKVEPKPVLPFKVAIPPAQVTGLNAAFDGATKEVRLTWNPNPEVDLLGYRVLRNPPGRNGFEPLPDLFTAPEFLDVGIDAPHRYQVVAVREGPDGPIEGKVSAAVTAGPEPPAPTLRSTPAPRRAPAGGNRPVVRRRTATTVDTGFSKNLPFDPSQTTTTQLPTDAEGNAAVLAEFDDDDDGRGTLVPIAGGLALLMSAVHVRLLSKRLGEEDLPILPGP